MLEDPEAVTEIVEAFAATHLPTVAAHGRER
jgi:hypothetical protein